MTSGADGDSYHSGGFLFRVMPPSWQAAPAGIRNGHSAGGPFFFAATKIRIGRGRSLPLRNQQAKPFSPASIRKFGLEIKNRCTKEGENGEKLTSILKSGLEIKNRCTKESENGEKLAAIRKSGPEIKNRCTHEGINRQNLAAIRKSGPEIKNQCTQEGVNREDRAGHPQHAFIR